MPEVLETVETLEIPKMSGLCATLAKRVVACHVLLAVSVVLALKLSSFIISAVLAQAMMLYLKTRAMKRGNNDGIDVNLGGG